MGETPVNDLNALSWLSPDQLTPAMKEKLLAMALNGDSIVNPLGAPYDQDDRTPQGRARREREEQESRVYEMVMAQLEERRIEFQRELDRLDHASFEALRENEDQLRKAREDLRRIQERAYEITMPDGTVARVYRDGDKVRTETGAAVDPNIVRPEDIGSGFSTWQERVGAQKGVSDLEARREAIQAYRTKLGEAREKHASDGLTVEELDALKASRPDDVRAHDPASGADADVSAARKADDAASRRALGQPFADATSGAERARVLSDNDFRDVRQSQPSSGRAPA